MPVNAKKNVKQNSGVRKSAKPADRRIQKERSKANRPRRSIKTQLQEKAGDSEQLTQLNRCLELALNNMARGLSMFDANQRLIVCNSRYIEMYDLPPDSVKRSR